jgi:hypothetical protein
MVEYDPGAAAGIAPELQDLLVLWQTLRQERGGAPPRSEAILANLRAKHLAEAALIVPGRRAGFVIETCGFDLIRRFGRYAAGHRVSALASGIREDLSRKLVLAMRKGEAVAARPRVAFGRVAVPFDEVFLPLARGTGGGVDLVLLYARESWVPPPKRGRERVEDWFAALEGRGAEPS